LRSGKEITKGTKRYGTGLLALQDRIRNKSERSTEAQKQGVSLMGAVKERGENHHRKGKFLKKKRQGEGKQGEGLQRLN